MKRTLDIKRLRDLIRLLADITRLHDRLTEKIQAKIDAIKRADTDGMREACDAEKTFIEAIREREGLRRQLMDAIGEGLGTSPGVARTLSVSQLADRIPVQERQVVLDAGARLRDSVVKMARANRIADNVARGVLHHLSNVFASVKPGDDSPVGYAGDGTLVGSSTTQILETVG